MLMHALHRKTGDTLIKNKVMNREWKIMKSIHINSSLILTGPMIRPTSMYWTWISAPFSNNKKNKITFKMLWINISIQKDSNWNVKKKFKSLKSFKITVSSRIFSHTLAPPNPSLRLRLLHHLLRRPSS